MTRFTWALSLLLAAPLAQAGSKRSPDSRSPSMARTAADLDEAVRRWLRNPPADRNGAVLSRWARAIGKREPRILIDAVAHGLRVDIPAEVRPTVETALTEALGRLADPRALPTLRAVFLSGNVPSARAAAARGLGATCRDAEATLLLAHAKAGDPLRAAAVEGLGRCLRPEAADRLAELLSSADASTAGPIAAALGRLASASVWSAPVRRDDPAGPRIRATAARALAGAIARVEVADAPRALAVVDHDETAGFVAEARASADAAGAARLDAAATRWARRRRVP
jgi:HEAT repeat protein